MSEERYYLTDSQMNRLTQLSKQLENFVREIAPGESGGGKLAFCALPSCGKEYVRHKVHQLFCSKECQKRFNNIKITKRANELGLAGGEQELTRKCNLQSCGALYSYTQKETQDPAWYLCPACRTLHPEWLKAHPEWQTPEKVKEELERLGGKQNKTGEDERDIYGNKLA
jgi:hypothetical protein